MNGKMVTDAAAAAASAVKTTQNAVYWTKKLVIITITTCKAIMAQKKYWLMAIDEEATRRGRSKKKKSCHSDTLCLSVCWVFYFEMSIGRRGILSSGKQSAHSVFYSSRHNKTTQHNTCPDNKGDVDRILAVKKWQTCSGCQNGSSTWQAIARARHWTVTQQRHHIYFH